MPRPYGPEQFQGNRFVVVLRDLSPRPPQRALAGARLPLPRDGLPNYFDDQRFGSVGSGGEFIAPAWLRGDHERALWLALAEPNPSDRPGDKAKKAVLRECWGRWPEAKADAGRSHARSLVTYLADHPADFRGAFARLRRELRSLYFSAFQSHLWNLMLGRGSSSRPGPSSESLIDVKVAILPIQRDLDPDRPQPSTALPLPLPSARTPLPDGPLRPRGRARSSSRSAGLGRPPGETPEGRLLLQRHPPPAGVSPATSSSRCSPMSCMPAGRH